MNFSSLNGFNWKPKHFNVLPAALSAKLKEITCTINDVDMWYILPLRSSILGSVVTNCCYKVQRLDLTQLKHLAVSMQWLHCFFRIFSGLLSHITILIFIFRCKKNIISLPLIVRGNYIQQELTKHKQTPVSSNLTWCTELTCDCDHIYF